MQSDKILIELYNVITEQLIEKKMTVTTMESCTGGMVASLLTDKEGASAVLKGAFVTYSNEAKQLQGVSADVIDTYGVYSEQTAVEMARACRKTYGAHIGIGVTGVFGNSDPANPEGKQGVAYYAIQIMERLVIRAVDLPPMPDRHHFKLLLCGHIGEDLLGLLKSF